MTRRDRLILLVIPALAVLVAGWLLVVSPERQKAAKLATEVSAASSQLSEADSQAAAARGAQARYASAYASIVSLGKAVPPGREVPSLVYELAQASNQKRVDFFSIAATSGAGSGSSSSPSAANGAASGGFTQMPFTFVFNGSFFDLERLFGELNRFTVRTASGGLQVSGRLLTIQSAKLAPMTSTSVGPKSGAGELTGTITATAYVLPVAQGLTGGATPVAPAGAGGSSTAPVPSSATASSSPSAPAVARVTP